MRYWIVFVLLLMTGVAGAEERIRAEALSLSAQRCIPGQRNIPLLFLRLTNEGNADYAAVGLTMTYTGTTDSAIAAGSIQVFEDADGDPVTEQDRTLLLGNGTFYSNSASLYGFSLTLSPGISRHIAVTAAVHTTVNDADHISASIENTADIAVTAPEGCAAAAPLTSLFDNGHHIDVIATHLDAVIPAGDIAAGDERSFIVTRRDDFGNIDTRGTDGTLVIEGNPDAAPSDAPSGNAPVYSGGGQWSDADNGMRLCSYRLFCAQEGVSIRLRDTAFMPTVLSAPITIHNAETTRYTLDRTMPPGADPVTSGQSCSFTGTAVDPWGNLCSDHNRNAQVEHSDDPRNSFAVAFSAGRLSFTLAFSVAGNYSIRLLQPEGGIRSASTSVQVIPQTTVARFSASVPDHISAKQAFTLNIRALDTAGNLVTAFNGPATLSLNTSGSIAPSQISLNRGIWSGTVNINTTASSSRISIHSSGVTTQLPPLSIEQPQTAVARARTWPTLFTPSHETVKIRYFLRTATDVHITIYNMADDAVRQLLFAAGGPGGQEGENIVQWNGKGDNGETGHSGAYEILIDKGYEHEWTAAVIKNW